MTNTYTITTISIDQLENMIVSNRADLIDEDACGRTFTRFTLIESGSWAGSYRGIVDGEDMLFSTQTRLSKLKGSLHK